MHRSNSGNRRRVTAIALAALSCVLVRGVSAAEPAEIRQAAARASGYLRSGLSNTQGGNGYRGLVAYALLKAGADKNSPAIQNAISGIQETIKDGEYVPAAAHHLYEAGVCAMLLAEVPGEIEDGAEHPYVAELEAISKYILKWQLSNGGWDYPPGHLRGNTRGDTSVTQYAMLGLWAAERAGVEVPSTSWQHAIEWHVANQEADGGFAYVPGTKNGFGKGASTLNMTVNAIGSTYIALLRLTPGHVPELKNPKVANVEPEAAPEDTRKFGILEKVDLDKLPSERKKENAPRGRVPPGTDQLLARAYGWLVNHFVADNDTTGFRAYYYYSLERMGSLANLNRIGEDDWFDVCADFLLQTQQKNGSWNLSTHPGDDRIDTAFAVLFLTRSTAKILKRTIAPDPIGGGLLSGGRGGLDGSKEPGAKKPLGPLDELLATLDSAGDLELADVQEQFVEKVQIGDRNELIKQTELLLRYRFHVNPEIRRTAIWALGRTDDLSLGRYLIDAFDDPDLSVVVEARNALCWLSRRPNGFGEAGNPLEALPPDASEDQVAAAVTAWRVELLKKWGNWYLKSRPYADRGDEFEAQLLEKLAAAS